MDTKHTKSNNYKNTMAQSSDLSVLIVTESQ